MNALLNPVSWRNIADGVEHYRATGFEPVEVPWIVPRRIIDATLPPGVLPSLVVRGGVREGFLVGSAEQAFLHLAETGVLRTPGRYLAVSPCFRADENDHLHGNHFVKLELVRFLGDEVEDPRASVDVMVEAALGFLERHLPLRRLRVDENQVDLVTVDGVEVGSYGYREFEGIRWVYGTGVAEPRLSTVARDLRGRVGSEPRAGA